VNKLIISFTTTIVILSNSTFAQQNTLPEPSALNESVPKSSCTARQFYWNSKLTRPYQTKLAALTGTAPTKQASVETQTTADSTPSGNSPSSAALLTLTKTIQPPLQDSPQTADWLFPLKRWSTSLGQNTSRLESLVPREFLPTPASETAEPLLQFAPRVSPEMFANEVQSGSHSRTDSLLAPATTNRGNAAPRSSAHASIGSSKPLALQGANSSWETQSKPTTATAESKRVITLVSPVLDQY